METKGYASTYTIDLDEALDYTVTRGMSFCEDHRRINKSI